MAISTPAQKPRGSARRTRSTGTSPRYWAAPHSLAPMPSARVESVAPDSPAARAGILVGDEVLAVNGEAVRDVIAYQIQADAAQVELEIRRGGLERVIEIRKGAGAPLGVQLGSAVFDRVRTCDNHCPFCFIY